jgi:hypothetical protein
MKKNNTSGPAMEQADVMSSMIGRLKTHSKITLIVRRDEIASGADPSGHR